MIEIKKAITQDDIKYCTNALLQFRPMLNKTDLFEQSKRMMQEGFQLIYIADDSRNQAAAILGFRVYEMYRTGKIIYIDDLFTFTEYRGKGYASALLDYVHKLAVKEDIKSVHLDSGYSLYPAHQLYFSKGYVLPCHHFAREIVKV